MPITNGLPGTPGFASRTEPALAESYACPAISVEPLGPAATPSMAPRPGAGHSLASRVPMNFLCLGKQGSSSAGMPDMPRRRHLLRQDYPTEPAAHELVALACGCFEPRPVDLNQGSSVGSDRTRCAELANGMRHRRPPNAKKLRERLLRQRQDVPVNPIVDLQQPSRQTCFDRV